jgi:hypothetical protein
MAKHTTRRSVSGKKLYAVLLVMLAFKLKGLKGQLAALPA